jgi:aminoglycoside phosphotransferase (APT) family kinase protein
MTVYSQRLGDIADAQFEAVVERFGLGRFVEATPITSGLFGQNVFVTTTEGEFVLRGAPHWVKGPRDAQWRREDRWQFSKEKFFAQLLHERTGVPVPWPMQHDESSDIFGWPYLVMPRMPGTCFEERAILTALPAQDRRAVAVAMGEMLTRMQALTAPFAGDFGTEPIAFEPYAEGLLGNIVAQTKASAAQARAHGAMTDGDDAWIAAACDAALAGGSRPVSFTHGDYKLNNVTVQRAESGWRVGGVFDLHEARFADGALDVVRQACSYLDTEPALASVFLCACGFLPPPARLPLYVIRDRVGFWAFFTAPDRHAGWTEGKTFRGWAERYVDAIAALL